MAKHYIDPSAAVNGDGSENSPFNTLDRALWVGYSHVAGNEYLIKAGTVWDKSYTGSMLDRNLYWGLSNATLGIYGKKTIPAVTELKYKKPILMPDVDGIVTQGIVFATNVNHVTVEDLEIAGHAGKTIQNGGSTNTNDISIVILRCDCHDSTGNFNGIDLRGQNCKILYCNLTNIGADAIWLDSNNAEVGFCTIINPSVHGTTGDGIQFSGTSGNIWCHDNYVDHRGVDSKHCIIVSTMTSGYSGGIIERNVCLAFVGGTVNKPVFIASQNMLVRYNLFKSGVNCVVSGGTGDNATGSEIYGNVFDGQGGYNLDIYALTVAVTGLKIHKNTFIRGNDGLPCVRNNYNDNQADITRNIFIGGLHGLEIRSLDTYSLNCFYGHSGTPIYNAQTATNPTLPEGSFIGDPLLDENYAPSSLSPCIGAGGKSWWGAVSRPNGYNGEPIPDDYMDIGAVQTVHHPFHPANMHH